MGQIFFLVWAIYIYKMDTAGLLNIIFSVVLTSLFICVFFFTLGSVLEKAVLRIQINNLVASLMGEYGQFLPEAYRRQIAAMNVAVDKEDDMKVEEANRAVFRKAIKALGAFLAVSVALVIYLVRARGVPMTTLRAIIGHNLVILFFVAVTYAVCSSAVGLNYWSADPNFVKRTLIRALKDT